MSEPIREVRRRIRTDHRQLVESVDDCADRVADRWDTARTTDGSAVVDSLRSELERTGSLERLRLTLVDVVAAAGYELPAEPVATPPYVVVTSRGPILRATIDPGRFVIRFDAFEVVRNRASDRPPAYRRRDGTRITISLE
ncbi:hypothetical protein [Natrarchaeobius chitinivorans]|uniref:DUF7988 domain-containing protein n=1 Tax=Natrarchaeobius chitinivorans TaxID=1679083 RepID=A0A3N6MBL0_NATCH|nr:hypothetical protein [Natrarchaeobius chitinivorans]RQG98074.1 hypothetical protein EA473_00230 [Natrarchaeobius chitinivorans]